MLKLKLLDSKRVRNSNYHILKKIAETNNTYLYYRYSASYLTIESDYHAVLIIFKIIQILLCFTIYLVYNKYQSV